MLDSVYKYSTHTPGYCTKYS